MLLLKKHCFAGLIIMTIMITAQFIPLPFSTQHTLYTPALLQAANDPKIDLEF